MPKIKRHKRMDKLTVPASTPKALGSCELCRKPATHLCHCAMCHDVLDGKGEDPAKGRPMCDECTYGKE